MNEYIKTTLQHGNCTIIVHRPVLPEAERAQREQAISDTIETVMRQQYERKRKETRQ